MTTTIDKKASRKMIKIAEAFLPDFINHLHINGELSTEDLEDRKIVLGKIGKFLSENKNIEFPFFIDHRNNILELANKETKDGSADFALALYGTFVEHTLNSIIHLVCQKKRINDKMKNTIIRQAPFEAKYTWLLKLLDLPSINEKYIKIISSISNERNAFIHYKWNAEPDHISEVEKKTKKYENLINEAKALVRYLKNYETKLKYGGNKMKIKKVMRKS